MRALFLFSPNDIGREKEDGKSVVLLACRAEATVIEEDEDGRRNEVDEDDGRNDVVDGRKGRQDADDGDG